MSTRRSWKFQRCKSAVLLVTLVTALAVLISSTGIRPAVATPAAGQDHVVRHDFQDPALAAHYVQQFDEIRASGKKLSQVLEERTKGQLHDVMPKLRYIDFDAEMRVEGTVAVVVIKDPGVVVDESWWQGALIVAGAMLVGAGATALCLTYGGGVPLCAGLGGFIGEFVNGALTQWANGELGNADEWAKTMAKSIAAGLAGFMIAFAGTAEALAWYKTTSAALV